MLRSLFQNLLGLVTPRAEEDLSAEERRELIRLRCRIPVTVASEAEVHQAVVTDLGLKGLQVKVGARLRPEEQVQVTHASAPDEFEHATLRCRVKWTRKRRMDRENLVGLLFDESPEVVEGSWVRYVLNALGLDEEHVFQRRAHIRASASIMADIYDLDRRRLDSGQLVNLGLGGALVQTPERLQEGLDVLVEVGPLNRLPVLELEGRVLRSRGDSDLRGFLHSIQFRDLGPDEMSALGDYVIHLLKEASAQSR